MNRNIGDACLHCSCKELQQALKFFFFLHVSSSSSNWKEALSTGVGCVPQAESQEKRVGETLALLARCTYDPNLLAKEVAFERQCAAKVFIQWLIGPAFPLKTICCCVRKEI